jgi:hypothetical protein
MRMRMQGMVGYFDSDTDTSSDSSSSSSSDEDDPEMRRRREMKEERRYRRRAERKGERRRLAHRPPLSMRTQARQLDSGTSTPASVCVFFSRFICGFVRTVRRFQCAHRRSN